MPQVTIYTTPVCQFCQMAKVYLQEHQVEYIEKDVSQDYLAAHEMVHKSGQMGVPVISIQNLAGEEKIIVGFNQLEIAQALGF